MKLPIMPVNEGDYKSPGQLALINKRKLRHKREVYYGSARSCRGERKSPIENLLVRANFTRVLEKDIDKGIKPEFVEERMWGFVDSRSFPYLLMEGKVKQFTDLVRLPPDKHEKLRALCHEGSFHVTHDSDALFNIDGRFWRYYAHLDFWLALDRIEMVDDFYATEVVDLDTLDRK